MKPFNKPLLATLAILISITAWAATNRLLEGTGIRVGATGGTLTLPNATDTVAVLAATQSLTNKTLGNTNTVTLKDTNFTLQDDSDTTKQATFQLSGLTAGTSIVLTVPEHNGTLVTTAASQTLTGKVLSGNTAVTLISGAGTLTLNTSGTATVPNATDTLVGKATTDTLTNKTISVASNTFSGFTNNAVITAGSSNLSTGISPGTSGNVLTSDGTSWSSATPSITPDQSYEISNCSLSASISAGAITLSVLDKGGSTPTGASPCKLGFRNATATNGLYSQATVTAANTMLVPATASLGLKTANAGDLYVYMFNNSATLTLGASLIPFYDEGILQSSSTTATSNQVIYQTTALTSKPVRLLGRLSATWTTGSGWSAITNFSLVPFKPATMASIVTGSTTVLSDEVTDFVTFTNLVKDPYNMFSGAVATATAPITGYYAAECELLLSGTFAANGVGQALIYVNGASVYTQTIKTFTAEAYVIPKATMFNHYVTAGQTIQCAAYGDVSASVPAVGGGTDNVYFAVRYLGP